MAKRIRVINTTKNIWFKSIKQAAAYAQVDGWTMSKKMETSGSFIDNNGDEYIRETPMQTKNTYKNTGKKLCKVGTHAKRTRICKQPDFVFQDLPMPVRDLINQEISRMLVSNTPWEQIKAFMLKMGCKKIVLSLEDL